MKIDAFCHLLPGAYADRLERLNGPPAAAANLRTRIAAIPSLVDVELRLRQLEEFGDDYRQIVSLPAPAPEDCGPPAVAAELARLGNEGLAEVVRSRPERFAGFVAALPLNDVDRALDEVEHACGELGALGVQVYTHVEGRPLDEPRFDPLYARLAELDRMIWVHPSRSALWPDYPTEARSRYELWWVFGWPYDTAVFMGRLVFSGVLERHPGLKVLIHHGGSLAPHFAGRIGPGLDQYGSRTPEDQREDVEHEPLSKRPLEYFKMFYADTALFGAGHALRCVLEFFGAEHMLFASDSPFDPERGPGYIRSTIANVDALELTERERKLIYAGNARRLLALR